MLARLALPPLSKSSRPETELLFLAKRDLSNRALSNKTK